MEEIALTEEKQNPKENNIINQIPSMKELVFSLIDTEFEYKVQKSNNKNKYNELLLNTDWDKINSERKEQGLPKLSNQSMKEAYIETLLSEEYNAEESMELEYNKLRRLYDVSMKYSFDILR